MTASHADQVLHEVDHLLADRALAEWPDQRLLERYVRGRDAAAFETLLRRHGPMVLRVCRAVLPNAHDAEDAFQATFLVLACNAARVRKLSCVGGFLHGTAQRVAARARARAWRRRTAERKAAQMRTETIEVGHRRDTPEATLYEELARLPDGYRRVVVLCHLEGRTQEQAARELGWPVGSVSRQLRKACGRLRERLVGRGVAPPSAGALVAALAGRSRGAVPAALVRTTVQAVGDHVAGSALAGGAGVSAVVLANEVLRTMNAIKLGGLAALALLIGVVAGGTALFAGGERSPGQKEGPPARKEAGPDEPVQPPMKEEAPAVAPGGNPLPPGAVARLLGSQRSLYVVAVAPDSKQVAAAGADGVIRLWDRTTGKEVRSWRAHEREIFGLAYSPDGSHLLSSGAYESARLWDVAEGKEIRAFAGATGSVRGVNNLGYSPDGKRVVLTTNRPAVQLVDVATGKVERTVAEGALIDRVQFSPDGKLLAGGGFDQTLHLWDAATGNEKWSAKPGSTVAAIAFAPDGRLVAAGTYNSQIILYDAATGQEVRRLPGRPGTIRAVAISPDGRLLAASGDTPDVTLYDLATGLRVQRLDGHGGNVWALAFAPDGRSLVSGSFDATALVWDLTGRELAKKQRGPLTDAELEARWATLGNPESGDAYPAVLSLANAPKQTAAFLRARLAGLTSPDEKVVVKWLADLDNDDFEVREKASRELARLGKGAETELRRTRAATQSSEVRQRLTALLEKLDAGEKADEALRGRRIVAVLELAATAETRELLEHLATQAATEELRRQAKGALDRSAKRP